MIHPSEETNELPKRPYTVRELATLYKVSKRTFNKWIKPFETEIGSRNGHFYSIHQVKAITDLLGMPDGFLEIDS